MPTARASDEVPRARPARLPPHRLYRVGPAGRRAGRASACTASRATRATSISSRGASRKGMRVVAPDLPGRGRSDWAATAPTTPRRSTSPPTAAVIARTGADAGRLDRHLARRPRRHGDGGAAEGAPIRRLVLNDFGARVAGAALQRIGAYLRIKRHFENVDGARGAPAHDPRALRPPHRRAVAPHRRAQRGEDARRATTASTTIPAIARAFSWPLMVDIALWNVWEKVSCPTLILRGEDSDLLHASTVRDMLKRGDRREEGLGALGRGARRAATRRRS